MFFFRRSSILLTLTVLFSFIVSQHSRALAAPAIDLETTFLKPFKTSREDLDLKLKIDNKGEALSKKITLLITIHKYSDFADHREGRMLFKRTIRIDKLAKGIWEKEVSYAPRLVKGEGSFPLRVQLLQDGTLIAEQHRRLLVFNGRRSFPQKVDLAMVWNAEQPPILKPAGIIDEEMKSKFSGNLLDIVHAADRFPSVALSFNLSPLFLEQLSRADVKVPATSSPIKMLGVTIANPNRQLLITPYASADIAQLSVMDWRSELFSQIRLGSNIQRKLQADRLSVLYPPGLSMDRAAIKDIAATGIKAVLWDGREFKESTPKEPLLLHDAEGTSIKALVVDKRGLNDLPQMDPEFSADILGERTLQEFLRKPSFRKQLMVLTIDAKRHSYDQLVEVLGKLNALPWLSTLTVGDAVDSYTDNQFELAPNDTHENSYYRKLNKYRLKFTNYIRIADESKEWQDTVWRNFRISTMALWSRNNHDQGLFYADQVEKAIDDEMSKISMEVTSVILTGKKGKIPVQLKSKRKKPISITVKAGGTGIDFPRGRSFHTALKAGENLITIPVTLGPAPAVARIELWAGNQKLAVKDSPLKGLTLWVWLIAFAFSGILVFGSFKVLKSFKKRTS